MSYVKDRQLKGRGVVRKGSEDGLSDAETGEGSWVACLSANGLAASQGSSPVVWIMGEWGWGTFHPFTNCFPDLCAAEAICKISVAEPVTCGDPRL